MGSAPPATNVHGLDAAVEAVRRHGAEWAQLPMRSRIALLDRRLEGYVRTMDEVVAAGCRARGYAPSSIESGEAPGGELVVTVSPADGFERLMCPGTRIASGCSPASGAGILFDTMATAFFQYGTSLSEPKPTAGMSPPASIPEPATLLLARAMGFALRRRLRQDGERTQVAA